MNKKITPSSTFEQIPFDHQQLMDTLNHLTMRYPSLGIGYLGESILGRGIPLITLGHGKKAVLYVGAHHGMEWITSILLTRFLKEFWELEYRGGSIYGYSIEELCNRYTLYILPMLNPDGVEYQIHGVQSNNPLFDRVMQMNGQSNDFSSWQANARGVDLNHNYDAGFAEYKRLEVENGIKGGSPTRYSGEAPESEPEVGYLCNFIRFHEEICGILTLHTQGEEIFYQSGGKCPQKSTAVAKKLAQITGYRLSVSEGLASFGGLTDWCVQKLDLPSFTVECGRGKNPLPISDHFPIYTRLRKIFFTFPTMF
jgi:g-D-glutamyl-meso-diaminopimelate peptidase